ncbi:MAG TPA: hypothetical protein VHV50_03345 [Actinomycetota bacterium]|nr:hypothetical protein [Actinomycetota bacterium]
MRTLAAGLRALGRTPLAVTPLAVEGAIAAGLIAAGAFPATGVSVPAVGVFPIDVYFDLKESLAHATGWVWFIGALVLSVTIRSLALAATLWLAGGTQSMLGMIWRRAGLLAAIALLALLPGAIFLFIGVAVRYAPFVWVGAVLGVVPAWLLLRSVAGWETNGTGRSRRRAPTVSGFLSYVYVLGALAAAMTLLARHGAWPAAVVLLLSGPVHATFFLGWREHLRTGVVPGGFPWAAIAMGMVVVVVFGSAGLDRFVRDGGPPAPAVAGTLALLGGINSTSSTGALSDIDPSRLGFSRSRTRVISYRSQPTYGESATHGNLTAAARVVAAQLQGTPKPIDLVGHSQAALILDRILKMHLSSPDKAVLLAAPPPYPPSVTVPQNGGRGPGKVAADIARPLSHVFELFGANGFNIDAPAAPFNLKRVVVANARIPRVDVWALGDSVWLEGDWRRPGETNVVAVTDHVGVTNDPRALTTAARFFAGRSLPSDASSWRGAAVDVLSYLFAPWRPG